MCGINLDKPKGNTGNENQCKSLILQLWIGLDGIAENGDRWSRKPLNLHGFRGFESHPHRQKTKGLARSKGLCKTQLFQLRANARSFFVALALLAQLLLHQFFDQVGGAFVISAHDVSVGF